MVRKSYTAQVQDWQKLTERKMLAVAVDSISDVMEGAQTPQMSVKRTGGSFELGKIPVDEGDLIQSLETGLNGAMGPKGEAAYVVSLAGLSIGDRFRAVWRAAHALPMEMGYTAANGTQVAGRQFVGKNAARWQEFVRKNAAKYRGMK